DAEDAEQVDVEHLPELFWGVRLRYANPGDTGIVDYHIDGSAVRESRVDGTFDGILIRDIELEHLEVEVLIASEFCQRSAVRRVAVRDVPHGRINTVPASCESLGRVAAESCACAGDQNPGRHQLLPF